MLDPYQYSSNPIVQQDTNKSGIFNDLHQQYEKETSNKANYIIWSEKYQEERWVTSEEYWDWIFGYISALKARVIISYGNLETKRATISQIIISLINKKN
jgi:hypothetical protein